MSIEITTYRTNAIVPGTDSVAVNTLWFRAAAVAKFIADNGIEARITSHCRFVMNVPFEQVSNCISKLHTNFPFSTISTTNLSEKTRILEAKLREDKEAAEKAAAAKNESMKEMTLAMRQIFENNWYGKTIAVGYYRFKINDFSGQPIPFALRDIRMGDFYFRGNNLDSSQYSFLNDCFNKAKDQHIKLKNF